MSRLQDAINEYKDGFKQKAPLEVQQIMLQATRSLEDAHISQNALIQGDTAITFTLPNALEKEVALDAILQKNDFAIISFYRGVWCAYCNMELRALQQHNEAFKALGAQLIAISPQSPDASMTTKEKNELEFEVLSDHDNVIAKAYGLVFSLAEELRPIYKSFNIDIPASNDESSYEIPMPATYVVDKNKKIIFSFVNEDYTKRCEPQEILEAIKKYSACKS